MKERLISISYLTVICTVLILIMMPIVNGAQKQESAEITTTTDDVDDGYNEEEVAVKDESENDDWDTKESEVEDLEDGAEDNQEPVSQNDLLIGSSTFGYEDALMLHKISVAEAGNQSVECMALVMLVVLNRVESNKFPDTIEKVIFQKHKGVAQFSPTASGGFDRAQPNEKSHKAMELVLSGWDESQNALYFESCKGESWHSRNLEFLFKDGKMKFYKEF